MTRKVCIGERSKRSDVIRTDLSVGNDDVVFGEEVVF